MEKVEIMSPVGSFESLMAAIQGGADAVYFGVGKLNMRSRSANHFEVEDMHSICQIGREQGVKTYLTVNSIIFDEELQEMQHLLEEAKKAGVSAVIVADLAAMVYARKIGVEVHLSTQCNVTNIEAVRFYAQFAEVIVLARELSLRQIADIISAIKEQEIRGPSGNLVQIEIFVHGALCMAVSGKCYISLDTANMSANKGACLQFCRRQYKVADYDNEIELQVDNSYIMSPKDLKTIDFVDKMVLAGVRVFKIEGRGRSAEYVKTVSRCYKEAVEAVEAGTYSKEKICEWEQRLSSVYNRGFWGGYYLGRKMGEWTERYGSQATQIKQYIGKVSNYFAKLKVAEVTIETHGMQVGDDLLIIGETTGVLEERLSELRLNLEPVQSVQKGAICSIPLTSQVRRGDKLYKIVSTVDPY